MEQINRLLVPNYTFVYKHLLTYIYRIMAKHLYYAQGCIHSSMYIITLFAKVMWGVRVTRVSAVYNDQKKLLCDLIQVFYNKLLT